MHQTTKSSGLMITVSPPHSLISDSQKPKVAFMCSSKQSLDEVLGKITALEKQNKAQCCPESSYLLLAAVNVEIQ